LAFECREANSGIIEGSRDLDPAGQGFVCVKPGRSSVKASN